jgi:squalene cyclase
MIDYSYVECTSASLTALYQFAQAFPDHRRAEIQRSIQWGRKFIKSIQRADGSWYGSWGVCFTYACWFGIEGLVKSGEPPDSPCIVMAVKFLLEHQNPNGGWGEGFSSSFDKAYAAKGAGQLGDGGSGVVQTAWALLALMAAENTSSKVQGAVERGVRFLLDKQCDSGDWEQEGITGVFNRACGITYTAYRNTMPIWALGMYNEHYKPLTSAL